MKRFKRIAALILAFAMCFTLLTATVSADVAKYIYYNGNVNTGGSAPSRTLFYPTTVDYEPGIWAKVSGPGSLVKEGYTFSGWNTNADGTGTGYSEGQWVKCPGHWSGGFIPIYIFDDLNLYAQWTVNTYDITFKTSTGGTIDGGTADILEEDVEHGTLMSDIEPEAVANHGYTFTGWSPVLPETVTQSETYTAEFTINDYTMTFDSMGGSAVAPIKQNYNTQVMKPADPSRTHYTFAGWYDSEDNPITFPYTLTDDITVYAKWTINRYTVMFNSQGGSSVTPVIQNYNTKVAKPTDPTRYGFIFSGWYTGVNGMGTAISFPHTLTGNITVYARWTSGTYTMSFNTDGGSTLSSISGNFGEYISGIATPTKEGYTFDGWYTGPNGTGSKITFPYNIAGNVTIYAKWIKTATVSEPVLSSAASTASVPAASQTQSAASVPQMGEQGLNSSSITIILLSAMMLSGLALFGIKKFKIKQQ